MAKMTKMKKWSLMPSNRVMLQYMKLGHKCTVISKNQQNRPMYGGELAKNASPTLIYRLPFFKTDVGKIGTAQLNQNSKAD